MKHKTAELEGALLDAVVARASGSATRANAPYSTDWAHGGPIIERERIAIMGEYEISEEGDDGWVAGWQSSSDEEVDYGFRRVAGQYWMQGRTPLVAAMRAYVASRFGEEVELP